MPGCTQETYRIAEGVPTSQGVGLVEWSNTDPALYKASNIIHMALERVDKLEPR